MIIKTNAEILERFYPDIIKACYKITNNHNLTPDLIQELSISILKLDNEFLNTLSDKDKFSYFYGMANKMFWLKKSTFYTTYRIDTYELEEYKLTPQEEFNLNEYLLELDLEPDERLWIRTYLRHDGNYTWISQSTGISRQQCSIRINYIKNKYKK